MNPLIPAYFRLYLYINATEAFHSNYNKFIKAEWYTLDGHVFYVAIRRVAFPDSHEITMFTLESIEQSVTSYGSIIAVLIKPSVAPQATSLQSH